MPLGFGGGIINCVPARVTVANRSAGASAYSSSNSRICVHARLIGSPDMRVALMNSGAPCHVSIGCIRTTNIVRVTAARSTSSDVSRAVRFDTASRCY